MPVIQQFGLDFDELHAALNQWMSISQPGNDDLKAKRVLMTSTGEAVATASTDCHSGLAQLDGQVLGLGSEATGQLSEYEKLVRQAESHLATGSSGREGATRMALSLL